MTLQETPSQTDTPASSPLVISMTNVGRIYGEGEAMTAALTGVDFQLSPGELVAVVGRSGSGKSTLLRLAVGLELATSGQVLVRGADPAGMREKDRSALRRQQIGVVFQKLNLLPDLTALENVSLPMELDGVASGEATRMAKAALDEVELGDRGGRYPDELSGGQQQRVAIARALVGQRSILLADEPTGALDEATGEGILELLRQRADRGAAVMLVTHDRALAAMADRVVELRDGRVHSVTDRSRTPTELADVWG